MLRPGVQGRLPVHIACLYGHLECVRNLLEYREGFDVDTCDERHRTCLHLASAGG